jgi:hypothetical protein
MATYSIRIATTRSWGATPKAQLTGHATGSGTAQARHFHVSVRTVDPDVDRTDPQDPAGQHAEQALRLALLH